MWAAEVGQKFLPAYFSEPADTGNDVQRKGDFHFDTGRRRKTGRVPRLYPQHAQEG
jgi:hypothetical protein